MLTTYTNDEQQPVKGLVMLFIDKHINFTSIPCGGSNQFDQKYMQLTHLTVILTLNTTSCNNRKLINKTHNISFIGVLTIDCNLHQI